MFAGHSNLPGIRANLQVLPILKHLTALEAAFWLAFNGLLPGQYIFVSKVASDANSTRLIAGGLRRSGSVDDCSGVSASCGSLPRLWLHVASNVHIRLTCYRDVSMMVTVGDLCLM
jgi:hypothetical protein